ncbi:MAG: fumarylacetoacetate hydrolase family protein [Fimbriimonadaceae bacterium]
MRIVRYRLGAHIHYGQTSGDGSGSVERLSGDLFSGLRPTGDVDFPDAILAPIEPPMVIGIGLNYRKHAEETNARIPEHPVVFFKALNAVCGPEQPIRLPRRLVSGKVDYEAELAVVIGRTCRDADRDSALSFVLGYTAANDVSARDWQKEWGGSQWSRAKSFDTFCPLGPVLVTADEFGDPNDKRVRATLNGEVVQDWTTADMIFDVPTLIEFLSADTTLPAGTVVLTGTPHGVGMARTPPRFLKPGDRIEVEIEGVGVLGNPVE